MYGPRAARTEVLCARQLQRTEQRRVRSTQRQVPAAQVLCVIVIVARSYNATCVRKGALLRVLRLSAQRVYLLYRYSGSNPPSLIHEAGWCMGR